MEPFKLLITLVFALAGGALGAWLRIPAGVIIGSMAGVALANLAGLPMGRIPQQAFFLLQVILGASLGLMVTRQSVMEVKNAWLPALIICGATLLFTVGVAWLIQRTTGWNGMTSFFSSAPGGMTDMVLLAHGTEADIPKVMAMHMVRLATVILSVPLILKLLTRSG